MPNSRNDDEDILSTPPDITQDALNAIDSKYHLIQTVFFVHISILNVFRVFPFLWFGFHFLAKCVEKSRSILLHIGYCNLVSIRPSPSARV